jgi:hypothetical protein
VKAIRLSACNDQLSAISYKNIFQYLMAIKAYTKKEGKRTEHLGQMSQNQS